MDIREEIEEQYDDEALLFADGFDEAIIGVSIGFTSRVVYDAQVMADILVKDDDNADYPSAWEYLDFNTFQAYVGEHTPIYVNLKKDYVITTD